MEVQIINGSRYINGIPQVPPQSVFSLPIEYTFNQHEMVEWFKRRWTDSIYWCIGYLLAIYIGQVNKSL